MDRYILPDARGRAGSPRWRTGSMFTGRARRFRPAFREASGIRKSGLRCKGIVDESCALAPCLLSRRVSGRAVVRVAQSAAGGARPPGALLSAGAYQSGAGPQGRDESDPRRGCGKSHPEYAGLFRTGYARTRPGRQDQSAQAAPQCGRPAGSGASQGGSGFLL